MLRTITKRGFTTAITIQEACLLPFVPVFPFRALCKSFLKLFTATLNSTIWLGASSAKSQPINLLPSVSVLARRSSVPPIASVN